jgi:hypothetical protein
LKSVYIKNRRGTIAALMSVLMAPLLMLLALSVDYGFLCYVKTELQRAADQSVLAAALELVPDDWGQQDTSAVRTMLRTSIQKNLGEGFEVEDVDIVIGRYDPDTIYSGLQILNTGVFDTVQVTLRRNDVANQSISLYFARLFNRDSAELYVTATAVLQKARYLGPGTGVLPIGVEQGAWDSFALGEELSVYGDGQIKDSVGQTVPGNWGTIDIGDGSNSTSDIRNQIINGLSQDDLDALHGDEIIDSPNYIDSTQEITLEGDTGFSAGMKHAMWEVEGQTKIIPIYDQVYGNGNLSSFDIVKWATVRIVDFQFSGSNNSFVEVRKSYLYDQAMRPIRDLSDQSDAIENAFTYPALIQ